MLHPTPTVRTDGLTVHVHGGEVLIHDEVRSEFHTLNVTASAVWRACDGTRTVAVIARETGFDPAVVELALDELGERGLLASGGSPSGLTRREVVRRLAAAGAVGAVALPVIGSITQSAAASPVTCGGVESPCIVNEDCCPGGGLICFNSLCVLT